MSASSAPRPDYRERIRLARERVQAAAAASHGRTAKRDHPAAVSSAAGQSRTSQAPLRIQPPPGLQPAPSPLPPPRPWRPDHNSWFAIGTGPSDIAPRQVASVAPTESIYSQPDAVDDSTTAGPSRSSYVTASHHSHASSVSSMGEIPDFPVPQHEVLYQPPAVPPPPRRASNLGPPPSTSARRGASSLYSQHYSLVSPILEESPQSTPMTERFSTVAASDPVLDPVHERTEQTFLEAPSDASNHNSLDLDDDDGDDGDVKVESPGLVRQASVGWKARPALTLVRSSATSPANKGVSPQGVSESATPTMARHPAVTTEQSDPSPLEPTIPKDAALSPALSMSPLTPVVEKIIGGLEKGGALAHGVHAPQILEADASQQAPRARSKPQKEDRTSTTSLAELIRRATRVRTNLDRGKTASRLGMLDMFSRSKDKLATYEKSDPDRGSMTDSMSGMIGWMPPRAPDAVGVQDMDQAEAVAVDHGATPQRAGKHGSHGKKRKKRKHCCGTPRWLFFLIIVLIIACVAAAVIVPVELLVVPHQNNNNAAITVSTCATTNACQNGASAVVLAGACTCACVNGFSGKNCQSAAAADGSCSNNTSSLPGAPGNITLGSDIPRLISDVSIRYGVNLNATAVSGAFSLSGDDCASENALITLQEKSRKRSSVGVQVPVDGPVPTAAPAYAAQHTTLLRVKRQDGTSAPPPSPAITSASLLLAASGSSLSNAAPTPSGNASLSAVTATATAMPIAHAMDFARVAILFILQQQGNSTAAQLAKSQLNQAFAASPYVGQVITFDDVSIDLNQMVVSVDNVSQGGKPSR